MLVGLSSANWSPWPQLVRSIAPSQTVPSIRAQWSAMPAALGRCTKKRHLPQHGHLRFEELPGSIGHRLGALGTGEKRYGADQEGEAPPADSELTYPAGTRRSSHSKVLCGGAECLSASSC